MPSNNYSVMVGLYYSGQEANLHDCLRALGGKTSRVLVYCRVNHLRNHDFKGPLARLTARASLLGITLVGGLELAYTCRELCGKLDWKWFWEHQHPVDNNPVKQLCYEVRSATGNAEVALVHEGVTDALYDAHATEQVPIPWATMKRFYSTLCAAGVVPWIDIPVMWPAIPSDEEFPTTCARYVKLVEQCFRPPLRYTRGFLKGTSRVHWMPIYQYGTMSDIVWQRETHKALVGSLHDRLSCRLEPRTNDAVWTIDDINRYLAEHEGPPPVLYPHNDDTDHLLRFCEALP